jgi:hypothetical protein
MMNWLKRIPLRESRGLIMACGLIFLTLLIVKITVDKPVKEERRIERFKTEGRVVAPEAYVPVWLYKGLQVNLLLAGAVLLASPWLGRTRKLEMSFRETSGISKTKPWELAACVVLMTLAAWHHAPRLSQSMWGDEEFNASRFILDQPERQTNGAVKMEPRSWVTTLWNMRKPTNHLGYSAFARLTHDTFSKKTTAPSASWFSEALLRTPVFIAGLLLIPVLFWALRVWGLTPWWALLMLMVHPWYLRFGVDGRGYGFVMLGVAFLIGALGKALQTGKWSWWVFFGTGQFFVMWSNMQAIYPCVALNLTALACLLSRDLKSEARKLLTSRWLLANLLTVLIMVGYMAPCLPQMLEFIEKAEIKGSLDLRWWQDSFCAWLFGQPWHPWDEPENPLRYAMLLSMQKLPWLHVLSMALVVILLVAGLLKLAWSKVQRPLLHFCLGAPALMILHMSLAGDRPYDWYFTCFMPGLMVMAAAGAGALQRFVQPTPVSAGILTVIWLGYAYVTREPRSLLRDHPLESTRESVAVYRSNANPRSPEIEKDVLSGALLMYTEGYDPALRRCKDLASLQALMQEADRSNRKLFINVGYLRYMRHSPGWQETYRFLEDPVNFEHIATFPGLLPYTTRDVFQYRGRKP